MSKLMKFTSKLLICIYFISITAGCNSSSEDKSAYKITKDAVKDAAMEKGESSIKNNVVLNATQKIVAGLYSKQKEKVSPYIDKTEKIPKDLKLLVNRGENIAPESVIRDIESKSQRSYVDFIDLGTCYIWIGNYTKAADAYESAARIATTPQQLGAALYTKAIAVSYVDINQALPITDFAVRVLPDNIEIARLRVTLHQNSSNLLGLAVAQDHLSKLDPSFVGHEVSALLGVVIVIAVTIVIVVALTPPEDRKDVVFSIMNNFHKITPGYNLIN